MKKRISAALLALVMMLSLLPVSAAAEVVPQTGTTKTGTATVKAYDWDTLEPISGAEIMLTVYRNDGKGANNPVLILGTANTDDSGKAEFSFGYSENYLTGTKSAGTTVNNFNPLTDRDKLYFDCGPTVAYQSLYNYDTANSKDGTYYIREIDPDVTLTNAKAVKATNYYNVQMVSASADAAAMNYGFVIWLKKTANACTVKFDANYAGAAGIASQTVAKGSKVTAPAEPTRTGYDFEGWFTTADHADDETAWDFTTGTVSADTTLYAHWTAKTYTVTYQYNAPTDYTGTAPNNAEENATYGTTYTVRDLTVFGDDATAPDGYEFNGWSTVSDGTDGESYTADQEISLGDNLKLYAQWKKSTTNPTTGYTVTWDANGGYFGEDTSKTTETESNITSVATAHAAPSKADTATTRYTFADWQTKTTNADGTDTYADVTFPYDVTANVTFYAKWTEEAIPSPDPDTYTYTLTYNANGGTDAPAAQTKANTTAASHTFTITSLIPEREDYHFLGWADSADATTVQYTGDGEGSTATSVTLTAPNTTKTIYAVWEAHVDADDDGACDKCHETWCKHSKDTDGCCTEANCNHSTECCKKHEEVPHGTITFTAYEWEQVGGADVPYTNEQGIEFFVKNKNGGSGCARASLGKATTDSAGKGSLTVYFNAEGYLTDKDGTLIQSGTTTFNIGDGDLRFDCDPVGASNVYDDAHPEHPGWNFSQAGRIRVFNTGVNTKAVTLKYDWAVGTWNDVVFTSDYISDGWKTDNFSMDLSLYIGEISRKTVTFDLDGGSASLKNDLTNVQTVERGKRVEYPYTAAPTFSGKTFYGWYKVGADGKLTGEKWEFDSETGYSDKGVNENLTLRAKWDNSDITVTFDVNGGDALAEADKTKSVKCNEAYGELPTPTRTGYTFEGWFTEKEHEAGETAITATSTCTETADHTLYAHWTPRSYVVSFDANYEGATDVFTPVEVTYDKAYGTLPTPAARTGFTFEGWFTSETHAVTESPITASSICKTAGAHTLYAHWTPNSGVKYTVEFWYQNIEDNDYTHTDDSYSTGTTGETITLTAASLGIDPHFTINEAKSTLSGAVKADGSLVLKVYLDRKTYTVTYDLNGGTTTSAQTRFEGCKYGSATPAIADPTKAADSTYTYTFAGWSPDVADTVSDTVTYTAQWRPAELPDFKIIYKANGGSGTMADTVVNANGVATVANNGFKAKSSKWEFSRWNTAADGSGKNYWPGNQLSLNGDLTLYAQWVRDWDDDDSSSTSVKLNTEDHLAYIQGYDDGTFRPTSNITRGAVSAILYRIMDKSDLRRYETDVNSYSDVNEDTWCNVYVSTLEKAGIIVDTPAGGAFRPYDAITRAELVTMLAQFADVTDTEGMDFSDVDTDHWAAREISIAAELGWIKGYEDGSFHPDATVTRAALVTMINRALNRVPSKTGNIITKRAITFTDCTPDDWYYIAIQEAANGHEYTRVNAKKDPADEKWTALLKTDVK